MTNLELGVEGELDHRQRGGILLGFFCRGGGPGVAGSDFADSGVGSSSQLRFPDVDVLSLAPCKPETGR